MNKTILAGFCALLVATDAALAQSTAFTYQGRLATNGAAVNGSNDFKFTLFSQFSSGVSAAGPITNFNVGVSNGLFTTALDFGAVGDAFYASDRWLEIATRTMGGGAFTTLSPRQPITPTPHALYAKYAGFTAAALTLNGPLPSFTFVGGYSQPVSITNSANQFRGAFTGSGGGLSNLNASQLTSGTVPDARLSANVALLNTNQTFSGSNHFTGAVVATNLNNRFTGNGAGLTSLNTTNLAGTIADARLSANVALLAGSQTFTGAKTFSSELVANGGLRLNDAPLWFRGGGDGNHGLKYYGGVNAFAGLAPDGPVLFGWAGGILGSKEGGEKAVLSWKSSGNVGIGTNNPQSTLHVAGTVTADNFLAAAASTEPPSGITPILAMIWIKPGTFIMGSPSAEVDRDSDEGPQTVVTITKGFWMGHHEVSQGEYLAVAGSNPGSPADDLNLPVNWVTWPEATNYCRLLTQRERIAGRLPPGWGYRLPTEAEWESACRAWTTTRFSYGDDPGYASLTNYAWHAGNNGGAAHPVGQKLPNRWWLADMHGNVWEWCQDWLGDYPGGTVSDPQGPATGTAKVLRGGGWYEPGRYCRSANRAPGVGFRDDFGFRVVLSSSQP